MNRSRLTEQSDVAWDPHGQVIVLSEYVHAVRGPVICPGAPLVAEWLNQRGTSSRIAGGAVLSTGQGGRLFATTYIDPSGVVAGIAVVSPPRWEAVAQEAVRVWSATLRTRRLIICGTPEVDCCRTSLVPPQTQARSGAAAVMEPRRTECPRAAAASAAAQQYEARGDTVLMLGRNGCPRFNAAARRPAWIEVLDEADAHTVQAADPERLSFVQQPCAPVEEVARILKVLRARFPLLRGQHPDQWCYRSSDRRRAVRAVTELSDLVLVSDDNPVASSVLFGPSVTFSALPSLRPEEIGAAATVGVIPAPSATDSADDATDAVIGVIRGLGPVSVVRHRVVTEVVTEEFARTPRAR